MWHHNAEIELTRDRSHVIETLLLLVTGGFFFRLVPCPAIPCDTAIYFRTA